LTIAFDSLFDRLGKIGHLAYLVNQHQAALPAEFEELLDLYNDDHPWAAPVAMVRDGLIRNQGGLPAAVSSLASTTVVEMVREDVPSVQTLNAALAELVAQMVAGSESVDVCAVAASAAAFAGNTGDGAVVLTTKRGDGLVQENLTAESARLVCSGDAQSRTATEGREPLRFAGAALTTTTWDHDHPSGSGASASFQAVSPSGGGLLTNGDFETWAAVGDVPSGWTLGVGTINVDLVRSGTAYDGVYAAQFTAGATLTEITQELDDLLPLTSYAVNFWARSSASIGGGVVTVALVDGAGAVTDDDAGVANSFTFDDGDLTATYAQLSGVFRTPRVMPDELHLRIKVTTALAGGNVLIDRACLARVSAPYPGGPGLVAFSGATPFLIGDGYTVTTTNDRAGATHLATFQALFDRLFNMRQLGLLLPSDAVPTQADTKITA
jgi:hypothetical protein